MPETRLIDDPVAPPPTEASAVVRGRVLQFDGLRAVAFLFVFVNHATHKPLLWAGVDIFFVLSGFLITGILLERKRKGDGYFSYFYRRRAFRILPPLALTIVVHGFLVSWTHYKPLWLFLLAPNLQALRPNSAGMLPLWSLAVEEQFYFVWPFVVLFFSERMLLRIASAALVLTPVLRAVCTPLFPNMFYIYTLTPFRADLLCAGAALALLWKQRDEKTIGRFHLGGALAAIGGFLLFAGTQAWPIFRLANNTRTANCFVYLFSMVGSAGVIAWVVSDEGFLRRALSWPPLRFLGEISYTMYLVHVVVLVLLEDRFGIYVVWVDLLAFAIVVLYATISWFVMERPLIRLGARGSRSSVPSAGALTT